ncbi:Hypothetical_protein [Hexamita inflata]|uniref:Hypothetical_protein n=1 Tax=Hexamita inflata TaxID=28002 RepID=A0AA86QQ46_9EUKA|nr:Hypothetical protein HINF_LOCUS49783 [Hexamita inflata]
MATEIMQQSTILTTVSNDNNFALFGFNHDLQQIQESVINITVGFNLYNGELICYQCDVQISNSVAVFIASGQFLSGLVFNSLLSIQLQNTTIQYRFQSQYSAGLAFNVSQDIETFILKSVTILGFNSIFTNQRLFVSQLNQQINITILQVQVCQNTTMSDTEIRYIILSNPVIYQCKSICEQNTYYVYGICATQTVNSEFMVSNGTFICIENALFDGQQCVCQENYVLNGSLCVSILLSLTNIYRRVDALTNVETDINSIYQLINDFNNSVVSELNSIAQNTLTMYNQSEAHLVNNISALNQKLNNNNDDLDQRIFSNVSALHQSIVQNSADMQQQINTTTQQLSNAISNTNNLINVSTNNLNKSLADINQSLSQNISQVNVNMLNVQGSLQTYILQNFTTLDQRLAFNITQKDIQIQQLTDSLAFVTSIVMNTVEQELWFECQQQLYTFKVFDLATATNAIQSSDFASGFAFDTQVIQNAFLDVQSISSSFTLFKTQSVFLNIKVQLNGVSFVSGAMLSPSQSIQINQLAVVSKVGTQVTINAGVVLSILQQTATVTNITNLLLNINMNPSSAGIISLINVVNGQLIVKGYQILGSYSSTNTISLCTQIIQQYSQVHLNYLDIQPSIFTCGNQSSLLLSQINICEVNISRVSIKIGDLTNFNEISSLSTTLTIYFQHGGLISQSNSSIIKINDISTIFYEYYNQVSSYSGQLIGLVNNSKIQLQVICTSEHLDSTQESQFYMFGILGYLNGEISFYQFSANLIILNTGFFNTVGTIGYINGTSANIINVQIEMILKDNQGTLAAALSGMMMCQQSQVVNATIQNSHIESKYVSSLISVSTKNITLIQVRSISNYANVNSNIANNQFSTFSGGLLGETWKQSIIQQCIVYNLTAAAYSCGAMASVAGLIVDPHQNQAFIQQCIVNSSFFSVSGDVKDLLSAGGIFGYMYDSVVQIEQTQVISTSISAVSTSDTYLGGFISYFRNYQFTIFDSIVKNVKITNSKDTFVGLIISKNGANVFIVTNVKTEGENSINGVLIANCPNAVNQTPSGC